MNPKSNINIVIERYAPELMTVEGVVGVYAGTLDNGVSCIAVMIRKRTAQIDKKLPTSLEGYPVSIRETGMLRQMK